MWQHTYNVWEGYEDTCFFNALIFCVGVYFWVYVYSKEGCQGCSFQQTDAALGQTNGEGNSLVSCERKWALEWKILQMWSIYSPVLALKVALSTVERKNTSDLGWCCFCCLWFIPSCRQDGRNRWCLSWWVTEEGRRVFCSAAEASLSSHCLCSWHRLMGRAGEEHNAHHSCYCCWRLLCRNCFFGAKSRKSASTKPTRCSPGTWNLMHLNYSVQNLRLLWKILHRCLWAQLVIIRNRIWLVTYNFEQFSSQF